MVASGRTVAFQQEVEGSNTLGDMYLNFFKLCTLVNVQQQYFSLTVTETIVMQPAGRRTCTAFGKRAKSRIGSAWWTRAYALSLEATRDDG